MEQQKSNSSIDTGTVKAQLQTDLYSGLEVKEPSSLHGVMRYFVHVASRSGELVTVTAMGSLTAIARWVGASCWFPYAAVVAVMVLSTVNRQNAQTRKY